MLITFFMNWNNISFFPFQGKFTRTQISFKKLLKQRVEVAKSLFSDVHKTFYMPCVYTYSFMYLIYVFSWNELLSITDYCKLRLWRSMWLSLLNCLMLILELNWVMPHGSFGLCRIFPILFSQNLLNLHFRISP